MAVNFRYITINVSLLTKNTTISARSVLRFGRRLKLVTPDRTEKWRNIIMMFIDSIKANSKSADTGKEFYNIHLFSSEFSKFIILAD